MHPAIHIGSGMALAGLSIYLGVMAYKSKKEGNCSCTQPTTGLAVVSGVVAFVLLVMGALKLRSHRAAVPKTPSPPVAGVPVPVVGHGVASAPAALPAAAPSPVKQRGFYRLV